MGNSYHNSLSLRPFWGNRSEFGVDDSVGSKFFLGGCQEPPPSRSLFLG